MVSHANYTKLKTNLQLAIQRLKLLEKKKMELTQKARKEIAEYLNTGKVERAKIRVEHIIREDFLVEAMEIVEMFCDTLLARFGMIEQIKTLDEGLEETVSSLIWVAPRMQADVKELKAVSDILAMKYGKPYAQSARENAMKTVNEKLMVKLGVQAPPKILVENYLIVIAKSLEVPYEPDQEILQENENYKRGGNSGGGGGGLRDPGVPPPAGLLIDLGLDAQSLNHSQPSHGGPPVLPPPLPVNPPAVHPSPSNPSLGPTTSPAHKGKLDGLGFENLNIESATAPEPEPATGAHPPSYDSVMSNLPDLSDLPTMPEVPDFDDLPKTGGNKPGGGGGGSGASNSNTSGGNNYDFDDLKRRFDELKKKNF